MLFMEHLELTEDLDNPLFLTVLRIKSHKGVSHKLFKGTTAYEVADANKSVHFESEFGIKCKREKKGNRYGKKYINVKLHAVNAHKGQKEVIGKWRFDAANLPRPDSPEVRESEIQCISGYGKATLFFRCVAVPAAAYPSGPPKNFFAFITSKAREPQVMEIVNPSTMSGTTDVDDETGTETVCVVRTSAVPDKPSDSFTTMGESLSQFRAPVPTQKTRPHGRLRIAEPKGEPKPESGKLRQSLPIGFKEPPSGSLQSNSTEKFMKQKTQDKAKAGRSMKLDAFLAQHGGKKGLAGSHSSFNNSSDGDGQENEDDTVLESVKRVTREFDALDKVNQRSVADLAAYQCMVYFGAAVVKTFIAPDNAAKDMSDILMEPITAFSILSLTGLREDHLEYLAEPFFKGLEYTLRQTHPIGSLFGVLATALNFGQKLSDAATLYTSAHAVVLSKLEPYVTNIVEVATQTLVAAIAPSICHDGFQFADDEAMQKIEEETQMFWNYAKGLKLPEQLVQVIVVETCAYFDALLFNVIIDTAEEFTEKKIVFLLQRIRKIQTMFQCLPSNFQAAFPRLLDFITRTQELWCLEDTVPDSRRSDLTRSVIERCKPRIVLPMGVTLDDVGKHLDSRESLKVPLPKVSFKFNFEWLYTQTATEKWD